MTPIAEQVNITAQFIKAVNALKGRGININDICLATDIDKRNLCRLIREPESHYPRPQWLTAICLCYGVSPAYLLLAEGEVFNGR